MQNIDIKDVKNNMGIAITIQLFLLTFIMLMKSYGSEIGIDVIKYRHILSYTLTVAFYFFSFGILNLYKRTLESSNKILEIINFIIMINIISMGVLILSFVATQRFTSVLLLLSNIVYSITLWVVCLSPIAIFLIIFFKVELRKKE